MRNPIQIMTAAAHGGCISGVLALAMTQAATAGSTCEQSKGPDLVMGDIAAVANYMSLGGIEAFSVGFVHCNIGDTWVNTIASPSTQHQLTGQNLFRLKTVNGTARLEQIGQSWLLDGFCSLQSTACCADCDPAPNCSHLGSQCSSPDSASAAGWQSALRPKWQVNASSGSFPIPAANPIFSGSVARRLQANISDINPAQNGGGQYFVEVYTIAPDDAAAGNQHNNASYRPCVITGSGAAWNLSLTGGTFSQQAAINAWHNADSSVMQTDIDVPGDGRFILAAKATDLGNGLWHYEYAVQNLNSHLSGQSFSVPLPRGASVTNIGFHDVDYHDGDGIDNVTIDGTDWPATVGATAITWATEDFGTTPNANALRFGTLYNFRFDSDAAPTTGEVTLNTFKTAGSVTASTIVPGAGALCPADIAPTDGNGQVNMDDMLEVINHWGPCVGSCTADITGNGEVNIDDLLVVINAWGPCP